MIGNSLKSDVLPVIHIGARAIHIPYAITWEHERVDQHQLVGKAFVTLNNMSEVLTYLKTVNEAG